DCSILEEKCSNEKVRILTAEQRARGESKPITISPTEAFRENIIISPWLAYWMCVSKRFISMIGVSDENNYFEEKLPSERAHYSRQTFDQIVIVDKWGKLEVSGHAYRHSYDLERHAKYSGSDLYALRQLKEPLVIKKRIARYDKKLILNIYGPRAGEVFKVLSNYSSEELLKVLESAVGDNVVIDGITIPKSVFVVEDSVEKVWVEKFIPHVSEPSFGAERLMYIALEYAYRELENGRIVLSLPKKLAPIKVGIATLVDKPLFKSMASKIYEMIKSRYYVLILEGESIGKKYAIADEIGIPFVVTIDYESISTGSTVTVRDRDTRRQVRVPLQDLVNVLDIGLEGYDIFSLSYQVIEPKD
ncbi:MAG: His/Gly/Thr/Pro-type tRNA ligase C-terminal domain-containing protein, partial [Ignisphaera sp.]